MKLGTRSSWLSGVLLALALCGCRTEILPDPNDPPSGQPVSGDVLVRNINQLVAGLDRRVQRGEITSAHRNQMVADLVKKMLKDVQFEHIPSKHAWQFGDAYRLSGDWKSAKLLYEKAVEAAKTSDRKVNDHLKLARAQAHLGQIEDAIATCKKTFDVDAKDKGPILMAVLYEVCPESEGKGHDFELAKLVEGAIAQHTATLVDQKSEAGKAFIRARPIHVHNAWIKAAKLYQDSGHGTEARQAILKEEESRRSSGIF